MSYVYYEHKALVFTEEGVAQLLRIRDHIHRMIALSGAFTMGKAINGAGAGDSWTMLACVDRLVEVGEIREIAQAGCAGQDRVFVAGRQ